MAEVTSSKGRSKGVQQTTLERFEAVGRMFGLNVRYIVDDGGTFFAQMGEGPGGPGWYGTDAVLTYHSEDNFWLIRGGYRIQRRETAVYLALYVHHRAADTEQLRSLLVQAVRRLDGGPEAGPNQLAQDGNPIGRRRAPWNGRLPGFLSQ